MLIVSSWSQLGPQHGSAVVGCVDGGWWNEKTQSTAYHKCLMSGGDMFELTENLYLSGRKTMSTNFKSSKSASKGDHDRWDEIMTKTDKDGNAPPKFNDLELKHIGLGDNFKLLLDVIVILWSTMLSIT